MTADDWQRLILLVAILGLIVMFLWAIGTDHYRRRK